MRFTDEDEESLFFFLEHEEEVFGKEDEDVWLGGPVEDTAFFFSLIPFCMMIGISFFISTGKGTLTLETSSNLAKYLNRSCLRFRPRLTYLLVWQMTWIKRSLSCSISMHLLERSRYFVAYTLSSVSAGIGCILATLSWWTSDVCQIWFSDGEPQPSTTNRREPSCSYKSANMMILVSLLTVCLLKKTKTRWRCLSLVWVPQHHSLRTWLFGFSFRRLLCVLVVSALSVDLFSCLHPCRLSFFLCQRIDQLHHSFP